ncbi:hypothetical protein [Mucilaginibacter arboris]|uniref:Uncharacterized protein n=1 Tax=Mucilaginibacter arboris TaxID=2682090 RepID=A0A7K1SSA0_9SPHI|nr:hypothetical protein [Mucilaginibacter arboris]MVN20117.1 hypothetical protein [Mucilaginibacter arboris]
MENNETEEVKNFDNLYYIVGLLAGIITAYIVQGTFLWMLIGAVLGLLSAGFYVSKVAPRDVEN